MDHKQFFADKEALRKKAHQEGSMLYEPPMPDDMANVDDNYEMQYKIAQALSEAFQAELKHNPDRSDDEIREQLALNNRSFAAFSRLNWTIWNKFTDRTKTEETRQKMLLTILIAHKVQVGHLEPEEAKARLSDLMGVDESKRAEIRDELLKNSGPCRP